MTLRQPTSRRAVRADKGTRRIAAPKNAPAVVQPSSRVCRYPGRDLLTGARLEAGADVRVVGEYEWYGPRTTRQKAEYGPILSGTAGIARELQDWAARRAAIADAASDAREQADEESA